MKFARETPGLHLHWRIIVFMALSGLLGAAAASALSRPTFESSTQLFVTTDEPARTADGSLSQLTYAIESRLDSYLVVAASPKVLQPVIDAMDLGMAPKDLAQKTSIAIEPQTVIITVKATDESPGRASQISESLAASFKRTVEELETPSEGGRSPITLSVLAGSNSPELITPNWVFNSLLGAFLGLGIGLSAAVTREMAEKAVRSQVDVRRSSEKPVLGSITISLGKVSAEDSSPLREEYYEIESYNQLRSNLRFASNPSGSNSILLAPCIAGRGGIANAMNLAFSEAKNGRRVLVVDGHVRTSSCGPSGIQSEVGFADILRGTADWKDCIQGTGDRNLFILPSGSLPLSPSEVPAGPQVRSAVQELERAFDMVIVDGPPVLANSAASALAQAVGRVLLIIDTQRLLDSQLVKALRTLEAVSAHVSGFVMNTVASQRAFGFRRPVRRSGPLLGEIEQNDVEGARTLQQGPSFRGIPRLRQVASTAGLTYFGMALSLLSAPMIARALGPEGRGELAAAFALIQLLGWLSFFGIPRGLSVQIGRQQRAGRNGLVVLSLLGAASTISAVFLADIVSNGNDTISAGIRVASFVLLGTGIAQYGGELLLATGRLLPWNLMRLSTAAIPSIAFILLFVSGDLNMESAYAFTLLGQVLSTIIGCIFAFRLHRSDERVKVPWKFGLKYWSASAFDSLGGRIDQIMLASLTPISNLGVYAVAVTCAAASGAIAQAINHTGFAGLLRAASDSGKADLTKKSLAGVVVSLLSGTAVVAGLSVFQEDLLGPGFDLLVPATALMILAQIAADQWQLRIYADSAMEDASGLWRSSGIALLVLLVAVTVLHATGRLDVITMAISMIIFGGVRLLGRYILRRND